MKSLANVLCDATDPAEFAGSYLKYLSELLNRVDTKAVAAFI